MPGLRLPNQKPGAEGTASPAPDRPFSQQEFLGPFCSTLATVPDALYGAPAVLRGAAGAGAVGAVAAVCRRAVAVCSRWDERALPGRAAESW